MLRLLKMSRDLQMFADMTHLAQGRNVEILVTSKMGKTQICLMVTRRPTLAINFLPGKCK
jgi:hypothetical protein